MSSFSSCPPPPRVVLFCVLLLFPISRTFPRAFNSLSLSLALSLRETQKTAPPSRDRYERRRYEVVDRLRALSLSLSLSASQKVATKRVNLKPLLFSPFQTSGKRSKTPQSLLFCTARITRKTFAHRKRIRERDDDATRREEASPRVHRPDAFLFFFFFIFHPRRGRIFAL